MERNENRPIDKPNKRNDGNRLEEIREEKREVDLTVHQMAGLLPDTVRERYSLPSGYEAVTGIAGYEGDIILLPETLREREVQPRGRKSLEEFVFS